MAGLARPSGVGNEADYTLISGSSDKFQTGAGLFDGTQVNEWDSDNVFYWQETGDYVEIEVTSYTFNIWRSGTTTWSDKNSSLTIQKWDTDTLSYVDVTANYTQTITVINETQWEKYISGLPSGKYKFSQIVNGGRIDSEWYLEAKEIKHLFEDGSDIKKWDSSWVTVGSSPVTETMFLNDGMNDLTDITINGLNQLVSTNPRILTYIDDNSANSLSTHITGVPNDKLIFPTDDINISSVDNIDSFTINTDVSGDGVLKIITSIDSGSTWKTWDGSNWVSINPTVSDAKLNGMTPAIFNAITSEEWETLRDNANTIRFAYYLELSATSDTANADALVSQFDMQGSWKRYKDADYEYISNTTLVVTVYEDGNYKINY